MEAEATDLHPVHRIVVERDIDVVVRDGNPVSGDRLASECERQVSANMNLGPSRQDKIWIPPNDLEEKPSPLMKWKAANPEQLALLPVVPNVEP